MLSDANWGCPVLTVAWLAAGKNGWLTSLSPHDIQFDQRVQYQLLLIVPFISLQDYKLIYSVYR